MKSFYNEGGLTGTKELMQKHRTSFPGKITKEKLFKIIAEFSVDWIYWYNPDQTIGYMSPSCKYITGYRPEEFQENPRLLLKLVAPEDRERFKQHNEEVRKGKVFCTEEFRIITKSGEQRWIAHACQSVYDDNNVYVGRYVSNRDITDLKNAWYNTHLKDDIYSAASIANYNVYPNGKIRYANKVFVEMLGYESIEEINEINMDEFIILNQEKRQKVKKILDAIGSMKNIESEWIKKDGSIVYIKENLSSIKDQSGAVLYYEGVTQNITEMKRAEMSIIEVQNKERKLEKLKAQFLATVSHEIRTPLNVILNLTQMMKSDPGKSDGSELIDNTNIIESEGRRIQRTIDLILEMSLLVTDTYDFKPEIFDLYGDVLKKIYLEHKNAAEAKNLEFILSDTTIDSVIIADKYSVYQIFNQLADNAIKYTKEGKVEISLYVSNDGKIVVDITDTGIGIDEKFIPYLFTTFSQEDNSYTRMFEGTGLGLAIVKKYSDLNDTQIIVESEKGKGSTFRVVFPKGYQKIR